MYEAPKLNCVGETEDVVLGVAMIGGDFDAMYLIGQMDFAEESIPEE